MNAIPNRYKTDLLILLIGENPLPNAVAAKLLLKEGGKVVLVHSATTREVANDLKIWLVRQGIQNYEFIEVAESDPVSIYRGIESILNRKDVQIPNVGLHYTGGTKSMSVHAYRAVERWADTKNKEPVFSYLDARSLSMVIGPSNTDSGSRSEIYPVSTAVEIPLRAMIELNGWDMKHPAASRVILPKTTEAILISSQDPAISSDWVSTKKEMLKPYWGFINGKKENHLKPVIFSIPELQSLAAIREAFRRETGLDPNHFTVGEAAGAAFKDWDPSGWRTMYPAKDFCLYLDGIWLENAVLQIMHEIKSVCSLHSVGRNIETEGISFDLDVAAIRGYQLIAISCTTMTRLDAGDGVDLKKKLFDAYVRARQLGGDEARIILVCMSHDPKQVEQSLAEMLIGETDNYSLRLDRRVKVFGRPDLADLANKLKDWILEQAGA